jgi:pilus assembly protein CpaC
MRVRGRPDDKQGNYSMRRFLGRLTTLAMFAAASLLVLSVMGVTEALAQQHQSFLRIGETANGTARQITLGLNKSMIVELPREVREVVVSNPEQIDAVLQTSTRAYLIGKKTGEANVIFVDKDGRQVVTLEVTTEHDFSALTEFFGRVIPGSRVKVDSLNGYVVLTGTVQNPIDAARAAEIAKAFVDKGLSAGSSVSSSTSNNTADSGGSSTGSTTTKTESGPTDDGKVINMITVEGREQVLLKVSVVEMERNIIKQFGVDLGALVNSGSFAFAALSKLPFPLGTQGGGVIAPFLPNSAISAGEVGGLGSPVGVSPGVAGGGVQWMSGESRVQTILRALEQDGLLHTLAEPNLTAISGETANFLAGGEFPVPVAQQLGTISVEFKKFGIGLAFTPVVMSEGRISLKVSTEVSELSNQGAVVLSNITIPALKVRRAETVVELPSGGSLVMAGLLSDQSKQALSGYPGLKNLPVLGTLFRSRDFLKNETELVVLVTPYVVKPVPRQELAQPDDGFGWASDLNTDLIGQMNRVYGRHPERAPVGRFDGDVGFIVE